MTTPNDTSDIPTKQCTKCGKEYPATVKYFCRDKRLKSGLYSSCKNCKSKQYRQYYKDNQEKMVERVKAWQGEHKEHVKLYRRKWYREINPEYISKWQRKNAEKRRAVKARYRSRKNRAGGSFTAKELREQYNRQNGLCYWCDRKLGIGYHADHVIPVSRGGDSNISNIVCSCEACNKSKSNKLPHEWDGTDKLL